MTDSTPLEPSDLLTRAKTFRELTEPDITVAPGSIIGMWLATAEALETASAELAALREQVAGQQVILNEIRMIPHWADGTGKGGYDVDGDEWSMINELVRRADPLTALAVYAETVKADAIGNLTPGEYRNKVGGVLHVIRQVSGVREFRTIDGDIWEAYAHDSLFGRSDYIVTAHSMKAAGYELVAPTEGASNE